MMDKKGIILVLVLFMYLSGIIPTISMKEVYSYSNVSSDIEGNINSHFFRNDIDIEPHKSSPEEIEDSDATEDKIFIIILIAVIGLSQILLFMYIFRMGPFKKYFENRSKIKILSPDYCCGQCGKEYTKQQWRRQKHWCDSCQKYVCFECIGGYPLLCPACASKVKKIGGIAFVGIGVSIFFLPMSILLLIQYGPSSGYIFPFLFAFTLFCLGIHDWIMLRRSRKIHHEYLSNLAAGIIQLKERDGIENNEVREKIKSKKRARSMSRSPLMKGILGPERFGHLKGDWDFPILSPKERIDLTQATQKKGKKGGMIFLFIGVVLISMHMFLFESYEILGIGILIFLFGLLILYIVKWGKEQVEKDTPIETKVGWKTVGYNSTYEAIESFIKETNRPFELELDDEVKKMLWNNPKRIYKLDNEIKIVSMYSESDDGHLFGWIAIQYRTLYFMEVKKILGELDTYLSEMDLIDTVR